MAALGISSDMPHTWKGSSDVLKRTGKTSVWAGSASVASPIVYAADDGRKVADRNLGRDGLGEEGPAAVPSGFWALMFRILKRLSPSAEPVLPTTDIADEKDSS